MMEVEFYRGKGNGNQLYHQNLERYSDHQSSDRHYDHGGTDRSMGSSSGRNGHIFYYGSEQNGGLMNGHANGKPAKMADYKSRDTSAAKDSDSVASFDSTGKQKSFRRLITRFAEKTSMQGVPYINNAKYWWAKLIWSVMLLAAIAVMSLHLWYLMDQYFNWPKQTKIALGFETLSFPEVTICNTNVMHKGRLERYDGAEELKELVEALQPEQLVPDQFDPDYDPYKSNSQENSQPEGQPDSNQQPGQSDAAGNQGSDQTQGNTPSSGKDSGNSVPSDGTPSPTEPTKPPPKRRKRFVDQYDNFNETKYKPDADDRPSPREVEEQEDDDFDGKVDSQTAIDDLFTELYMDIGKAQRARLGHNITDMLISCTFNGRQCSADMFTLHQTSEYGNCWSIRSEKFKVKNSGPSGGLTLVMFLEVREYLKGVTTGYGARVQVHEQSTYPFPAQEGLFIPASMETDIGLRMTAIERLGGNYGSCDGGEGFKNDYGLKHTRRACQAFCKMSKIIEKCECFAEKAEEFADQKNSDLRPCRSTKEVKCMVDIQRQFASQTLSCSCDNPCNEVQYTKAVSQRQWPTEEYALVLLQGVCDKDKAACATIRDDIDDANKVKGNSLINNNFMKLNIYYEDLNYENITEQPEIELQQFLSDVGGAIGLWIGLSILSMCELIQLFVELCDYGIHKAGKNRRSERKKRRKERKKRGINNNSLAEKDENQWPNTNFRNENKDGRNGYLTAPQPNGFERYQDFSHPGINERPFGEDYNSHHYSSVRH